MTGLEDTRWGCSFLQGPGGHMPTYSLAIRDTFPRSAFSVTLPHNGHTEADRCRGAQFASCGP